MHSSDNSEIHYGKNFVLILLNKKYVPGYLAVCSQRSLKQGLRLIWLPNTIFSKSKARKNNEPIYRKHYYEIASRASVVTSVIANKLRFMITLHDGSWSPSYFFAKTDTKTVEKLIMALDLNLSHLDVTDLQGKDLYLTTRNLNVTQKQATRGQ